MSEHLESFKSFLKQRVKTSDAYLRGDAAPFLEICTKKSPATFFSPGGALVEGAEKVAATHESGAQIFESFDANKFETLHQNADENIAYWVGLQKSIVTMKVKKDAVPMTIRVTEIFRRENDEWKIIHRHADFLKEEKKEKE